MLLISLLIKGMSCNGSERSVEAALGELPGITNVKADHTTGRVQVEYFKAPPSKETITDTLKSVGFALSY